MLCVKGKCKIGWALVLKKTKKVAYVVLSAVCDAIIASWKGLEDEVYECSRLTLVSGRGVSGGVSGRGVSGRGVSGGVSGRVVSGGVSGRGVSGRSVSGRGVSGVGLVKSKGKTADEVLYAVIEVCKQI